MSERKSIMRSLGEFFGHIAHGVRTDPSKPVADRTVVREQTEEAGHETPDGRRITLRRTVIEEIEVLPARPDHGPQRVGGSGPS